jgi:hypothetical protein
MTLQELIQRQSAIVNYIVENQISFPNDIIRTETLNLEKETLMCLNNVQDELERLRAKVNENTNNKESTND